MGNILLGIVGAMIGPISGLITTRVMDYVDDVLKLTNGLPDAIKQLVVMALAAVIPLLNAQYGFHLAPDYQTLLSQPSVQYIVSVVLAFVLKGHAQAKAIAAG